MSPRTTKSTSPPLRRLALHCLAGGLALSLLGSGVSAATTGVDTAPADAAKAGRWQVLKPTNTGIPGDIATSVAVDGQDRAWVTAHDPIWEEGGLGQLTGSRWRQWTNVDGTSVTPQAENVRFDAEGTPWMTSTIGLLRFDGRRVEKVWSRDNAPWPVDQVHDHDWDSAGNLWVALGDVTTGEGGVARYNGTSWKVWDTSNGLPWPSPWDQVWALEVGADDRVWIGSPTQGGAVYDGGRWEALGDGSGTWVNDIAVAPDGTPWFSFANWGVRTWSGTGWVDRTGTFGDADISLVTTDREGRVWIGTFLGTVWRWSGSGSTWDESYDPPSLSSHITGLAFDSGNQPYVSGIGGLDIGRADGSWKIHTTRTSALPSRFVDHVMIDDDGRGWLSTAGGGIGVYDGKRWTDYNPANWGTAPWPFGTDSSNATVQADDGTVWAAPYGQGVGAWDGKKWIKHLPGTFVESLTVDPAGDVWAAPETGEVQRWNGSRWTGMDNPTGEAGLQEIAADDGGVVWLASRVGLLRYEDGSWTTYTPENSDLPDQAVLSVTPEPGSDAVWVGTASGVARFDGTRWKVYTQARSGLPADTVTSIAIAPNGHVWLGAFDGGEWPYHGGLARFDGRRWKSWTTSTSPLPHNQVEAVAVDAMGRVWIGTQSEGAAIFRPRAR